MKKNWLVFGAALLFLFVTLPGALGCTQPPPQPPKPWIVSAGPVELLPCGPKYEMYWIVFHDFTTFQAQPGNICGCALNVAGPIVQVTGAKLVDQATGRNCPGFDFCSYPGVSTSASQVTGAGNFGGFLSQISQNVPSGLSCDLWVCVLTKPKTTFNELATHLANNGLVVTGEVDENGNFFDPDHLNVTKLSYGAPGYISISERPVGVSGLPELIEELDKDR